VEFFFIDTNPFVEEYWTTKSLYAWQLPILQKDYIMEELMVPALCIDSHRDRE
jgi:hypothetical protein